MRELNAEEIKRCQLEILRAFHEFCENEGLTYYLYFGTLLGAVRHHGYIPWDDDIDVAMPRKDYERLIRSFSGPENLKVVHYSNTPDYYLPFAKIVDTKTVLKEDVIPKLDLGVYIDIFPLESIADSFRKARAVYLYNKCLSRILQLKVYPYRFSFTWKQAVKTLTKPLSIRTVIKRMDRNVKNRNFNGYMCNALWPTYRNEIFRKELFDGRILVPFEDLQLYIPEHYDEILSGLYGDYMKLPPEDKRVKKHHNNIWIKE